jgi:FtsP/CotA-like multicopper oxidase with cupredoxin domain
MKSPISRREFVALTGGVVAGAALTRATSGHDSPRHPITRFEVPLPIPHVLEPIRTDATTDYYEIVQREERVEAVRTRQFVFSVRPSFGPLPNPSWRINGQRFEPETPIASPRYADVEIWHFTNKRFLGLLGIVHPVHVHLVTFKVLERNGGPPLAHETGWKDTVAVDRDEDVSVIAKFDGYRGRYLLHCHNLEHEDHSMMARFDVV